MFGSVRGLGYRNNNPNCMMFSSSYKTLLLNNLMSSHSPRSNCEEDLGTSSLAQYHTLFKTFADNKTTQEDEDDNVETRVSDGPLKVKYNSNIESIKLENQIKSYIAGYTIKKLNTTFLKNCSLCLSQICAESKHSDDHQLTLSRDYCLGGKYNLKYPNTMFCKLVQGIIDLIAKILPSICHHLSLKADLINTIDQHFNVNVIKCPDHQLLFGQKLKKFTIKLMVHNWCTQINRLLAGTINLSKNENDHIKINAFSRYKTFSKKLKYRK